ncbi:DUF6737 family protein [Synechococcus sp. ATX 2A4]|uniref:DUF6737 family protein n=1 Tax=Synechococcus sp. ATX 2A4 TaxID=2823727 RepID=UPI0020CE073C|nr:DUF6737 family protein [Synechococcus sp. ATX 2A4]
MTPSAPFWSQKPWWCQPWSIVATGSAVSVASWVLLQRWWITTPVVAAVLAWWWLFLVLVPGATAADLRLQATADRDEQDQASSGAADQGVSRSADLDP